jgi:hypothetical protein
MKIAFIGQTYFAHRLSETFKKKGHTTSVYDYNNWGRKFFPSMYEIKNYDILHFISGTGLRKFIYAIFIKYYYKKIIIVHFVGSDVTRLKTRRIFDQLNWILAIKSAHRVFCVSSWLTEEIRSYCNAETFPLFFQKFNYEPKIMPKKFTILSYIPLSRPDFYGETYVQGLIESNPDINFIILGSNKLRSYPNVETHSINYNINMFQYYNRTSLLLRLTEHDGLSNMVLEALSLDRNVIWTYKFPFVQTVKRDLNQIQNTINQLKNEKINIGASKWVKKNFVYESLVDQLESLYKNPKIKIKPLRVS